MLTSKQRSYLRGLAAKENTILQIGKDGITENTTAALSDALQGVLQTVGVVDALRLAEALDAQAAAMRVRQWFGQGVVDAPVSTGDRLGTRPLDGVEGGQNDRLPPQVPDQGAGQHDAFVGLHRQLGQHLDGLPVMAHGEGPETEHGLQLAQVLAPGLLPLAVLVPAFDADLELVGDQLQQGRER